MRWGLLLNAAALVLVQFSAQAGPEKGAGHLNFPDVVLTQMARGQNAIQALGEKLPDVARAYGLEPDQLKAWLTGDLSLAVDLKGRLHFTDPAPDQNTLTMEGSTPEQALVPLADTFKLHSRPGARRIIYLDFDGHLISGTGWNTSFNSGRDIVAPPWDIDGSPSVFGDVERTIIQQIWQRVAEDYAPFEVDVTTELLSESLISRSTTSDENFGTRVLVSAISSYFGNYGGIAYVGAFDDLNNQYKPALVFPENLANSEKYIAEAVSHEAGHNLGLSHDGTTSGETYYTGHGSGTTGWAPIMGAGYYKNVTQWSKGDYAYANNKQDDLSAMQGYGLPPAADDHGNTVATASYLTGTTQLSASGVIERSTDVDVFAFTTAAGVIGITIAGSDLGPNLDILAEIRDASGTLLVANNPPDQLNATFNLSAGAGTYFIYVRGTGFGDPLSTGYSNYASVGQYNILASVVAPDGNQPPIAVATANPTSGTAPLSVQFSGANSSDPDGSIVSYQWNFGDGSTGSGSSVQHTYPSAGTYVATLTVTDDRGASASTTVNVQAQQNPGAILRVQSIALTSSTQSSWNTVRAVVTVTDAAGSPVSGARVDGSFDSIVNGTATATTDAGGIAVLTSRRTKKSGAVTFTVTNLGKESYGYDPSQNLQSSATITVGR